MTPLQHLLERYRSVSQSEREKGTYFEELIVTYLKHEATYKELYSDVWLYSDWAKEQGIDGRDIGIDLVAKTQGTDEYHAIQCKCYATDYRVQKRDIDSFFTASGKKPFTRRIIVTTSNNWNEHADDALRDQQPPVTKIDLNDLENSQIDWSLYQPNEEVVLKAKKELRPHQVNALNAVKKGLMSAERGKLIMACGTGKTFTSLKVAEELAGKGKRVLFLVPSLSLLSQTLTEWTQESQTPLHSFAVCSDSEVGKKRKKDDDAVNTYAHELRFPATTNHESLAKAMEKRHDEHHMSVVFSTYHSIDVINKAQTLSGLADFDLIICDEAHRTTGATFVGDDESNFVKVHDQDFIKSKKRLFMTATPRIYHDLAKAKAEQEDAVLCSMDDPALYGEELFTINFSEAVQRGLLCDYKVIVLTVSQDHISSRLQSLLKDEDNQLKVDDAAKIIGCWKALSKQSEDASDDTDPMRRAVAFCQVIEPVSSKSKNSTHKVSSKNIASMFKEVVDAYQEQEEEHHTLKCEAEHVDGSMNASQKEAKLNWLKEESPDDTCRILSNVRCLSEGVDVPALDAVLFLTPRNSQVDVVQSVGRVMRNAPGKDRGYVILPVVIPSGVEPHEALNDNKTYKVVWEVLQALRSHDDRFDAMINKLDLIGKDHNKMEVIAITDQISKKSVASKDSKKTGKGEYGIGEKQAGYDAEGQIKDQHGLQFEVGEIEKALYAKVVKKCGNRNYWTEWAKDISDIATTHISRIKAIVSDINNTKEVEAFTRFADELRDDLNDSITNDEVIEMLAQHLITKPVFDALFKEYSFASNNPVSLAMQQVLDLLQEHNIDKEADTLEKFYASVQMRAEGIDSAQGKQKIVVELYDKFFRNAFPRMTDRLGIVYTPVEVVDFIIHSIDDLLKQEFGQSLGSEGVHIIDPFTGTGTFVTRLLQSGLISKEQLPHKYKHEIHANELVLLAYYIAAVNIEAVYHSLVGGEYQPFEGICLTDTFQLYEKDDLVSELLADNSDRRNRQKNLDIRVIMGNPPYSAGQTSANDNNANIAYEGLDNRIRDTYAAHSSATNKNALYDSYIRAIRWASDRIGNSGIIGFVTNAGFLEANTADGLRKCLAEEFSSIYVFHLRGNARTSGEIRRKEKDNVFGQGTRTPIAMTFLVKKPTVTTGGKIHWYDIGDYLTQQQKLDKIADFASLKGITQANAWSELIPDEHHDWTNQRDDSFENFIKIGDKKDKQGKYLFNTFSRGLETSRDVWCYNSSKSNLKENMALTIDFYNSEVERFNKHKPKILKDFVNNDPAKISWTSSLLPKVEKQIRAVFEFNHLIHSTYRPFQKQWVYFDGMFNHRVGLMPKIMPNADCENRVISLTGLGTTKGLTLLMCNVIPDIQLHANGQCFPLYLYEKVEDDSIDFGDSGDLFAAQPEAKSEGGYTRKDGISDAGLAHFQAAYPDEEITKEDIFYYVYGLLHSQDYRDRYADNLSKELPRIPRVKNAKDFWHFSQAGRDLAELHINYETVTPYPVTLDCGKRSIKQLSNDDFRVTKMKLAKKGEKHTIIYNHAITVRDIPVEAYDYVVNGKAAIEWVMDRQCVKTDKDSGIVNDANDWAIETMNNPKYPLELLQRVITVSLETMKIVNNLPVLDID
ncbi:MAG: DEAD/DEAH box helicase [Marinomonas foliarum]|uniref:DEAD/DEAH box helicase n=1 Tax=Marinomonas foliarum TaxID=491950 RepID=UPI003F99EA53